MEVRITRKVGRGASASVYLMDVKLKQLRYQLALKVIELGSTVKTELEIMKSVKHKNIVCFFDVYKHKDNLMLLMEYCGGGDLFDYIQSHRPTNLAEEEVLDLGFQIASAIKFLHENHIIHRDIKTKNIFLTDYQTIKVGDFGISRQLENTMADAITYTGTPLYMAPEIIEFRPYSFKADSWSFGCCLHELMSMKYAFKDDKNPDQNIRSTILNAEYCPLPIQYSINLCELVEGMLQVDEKRRLHVGDVHSFLEGMMEQKKMSFSGSSKLPTLPEKKQVVRALSEFSKREMNDYSSDDYVEEKQYSDDFESSSSSNEQTFNHTVIRFPGIPQDDATYAKEISNGLRSKLDCLNISENTSDVTDVRASQKHNNTPKKADYHKKKKKFLKERSKSVEEAISPLSQTVPVILYTRSQKVSFSKQDEKDSNHGDEIDIFKTNVEEKCRKEVGEADYLKASNLVAVVKDSKLLENHLKEVLGTVNYKKYKNIFVKPNSLK